jgi:hypothetical protein
MDETLKLDGNFLMNTFDSKTCYDRYWKPYFDEKGWKLKQFHLSRLHAPNHWFFFDKFPCFLDQNFEIFFSLVNFTKFWGKNHQHTWKLIFWETFLGGGGEGVWGWISVPHKRQAIHYFWQPCLLPKAPSSFPTSSLPPSLHPTSQPQRTIWNRTSYLQLGAYKF